MQEAECSVLPAAVCLLLANNQKAICAGMFSLKSLIPAPKAQKGATVSHYSVEDLIARWKKEELTVEQVIGQVLQVLREHDRRLREAARAAPAKSQDVQGHYTQEK